MLLSFVVAFTMAALTQPDAAGADDPREHILVSGDMTDVLSRWYGQQSASGVGIRQVAEAVPFIVDVPKIDDAVRGEALGAAPGVSVHVSVEVKRIDGLEPTFPIDEVVVVLGDPETNGDVNMTYDTGGMTGLIPGTTTSVTYQAENPPNDPLLVYGSPGEANSAPNVDGWSHAVNIYDEIPMTQMGAGVDNDGYALWAADIDTTGYGSQDYYLSIFVRSSADGRSFLFDNLAGFTLEPYASLNSVVLVDDFMCGQRAKFFLAPYRGNYGPSEEASYATVGWPIESYFGRTVQGQYLDGDPVSYSTNHTIAGQDAPFAGGGVEPTWEVDYDKWRIACRGPIPWEVLETYIPADHYVHNDDTKEYPYGEIDGPTDDGSHPGFPIFAVTQVNGFPSRPDTTEERSMDIMVADHFVIWSAPYSGDLVLGTESGTMTDAATQANLRDFVNEGGRLLVTGQDLGWALTLNGSIATPPFFTDTLGATFVRDDVFNNGGGVTASAVGGHPIAVGPRGGWETRAPTGNPVNLHYIAEGGTQNEWPDVIASAGGVAAYTYGQGGVAAVSKTGFPRNGMTAYLAFGLEGVCNEYELIDTIWWSFNYRQKILMNTGNWMRTSTIYGRVTTSASSDLPPGSPRAGAFVVATDSRGMSYGVFTDADGRYRFRGLPVDNYTMTAQYSGELADHPASTKTWGKEPVDINDPVLARDTLATGGAPYYDTTFQRREDFNLLPAPPGALEGYVYADLDLDGNGTLDDPVANIEVHAVGRTLDPPLDGDPIFDETVRTDADGYYFIETVPVDTYDIYANERRLLNYDSGVANDVIVQAGQTERTDFFLGPLPGTIQGMVTDDEDGTGVLGANVLIETLGLQVTTDETGAYLLETVPAGAHTVDVDAPGYLSGTADITLVPGGTVTQNFELERVPAGTVTGQVTDSSGITGVPGISVAAFFGGVKVTNPAPAVTDVEGAYSLELPASTYTIKLSAAAGEAQLGFEPSAGIEVVIVSDATVLGIDFRIVPAATMPAGLTILGPAYTYSEQTPPSVFGVAAADLKLATWVPLRGEYAVYAADGPPIEVATLNRGAGYFALFDSQVDILSEGTPTSDDTESRRALVPVSLSPAAGGWNLIGNPYDYGVDFSLTTVRYQGQDLSLAEAAASGVISDTLFTYANGYQESNLLPAWRGGWVRVNVPDVVLALSNQRVNALAVMAKSASVLPRGMDWKLRLIAEADDLSDGATWIGASSSASEAYDPAYDVPEPPSVRQITGRELSVYFPRTDLGIDSGHYTADVRGRITGAESWDMVVQGVGVRSDVRMSWPDMRSLPRYYTATLTDTDTGRQINMRSASNYEFGLGDTGLKNLRLTVRWADAGGGLVIEGTGQTRGLSTVTYRTANDASVDVKVLNAAGRIIRKLVEGQVRSAGRHTEMWDGRDDRGTMVPAGFYTIEVKGVFDDGTTTRAATRMGR